MKALPHILFILALLFTLPAMAQDAKPAADITKGITIEGQNKPKAEDITQMAMRRALEKLSKLPPKIQESLTEEAAGTEAYCAENDTLSNFYDCSCFSLRMLEHRIDQGPDVDIISMIMAGNFQECISDPMIAGYTYTTCQDVISLGRKSDEENDTLCKCAGRKMAVLYRARPAADARYIEALFSKAMDACREELR